MKENLLSGLKSENREQVTKYLFLEDADLQGDIGFVFGTWKTWQESVQKAAELYKRGLIPKVIVSGGKNGTTGIIEGDFMAAELEKLGVPKEDILIEDRSTNSLENVIFSQGILNQKIGIENIHTITAIVRNYHARRALMTLKKNMPPHIKLKAAPYVSARYPFTKNNWHQSGLGRQKVVEEMEKIKKYLAKDDLAELTP